MSSEAVLRVSRSAYVASIFIRLSSLGNSIPRFSEILVDVCSKAEVISSFQEPC